MSFLEHLERKRGNSAGTRNARLAAINAFFRFLEYRLPSWLDQASRIHPIPMKKTDQALVSYLTRDALQALLDAPDPRAASGVRDRAMLLLAFAAGLRVSELVCVRLDQIDRQDLSSVHIIGKGRRERVLPLWKETAAEVKAWLRVRPASGNPAWFLNAKAQAMTRSGFEYLLAKHVATAADRQPSITGKRVTPHVLRHTYAMHTLQATRDVRKESLWLGHASRSASCRRFHLHSSALFQSVSSQASRLASRFQGGWPPVMATTTGLYCWLISMALSSVISSQSDFDINGSSAGQ